MLCATCSSTPQTAARTSMATARLRCRGRLQGNTHVRERRLAVRGLVLVDDALAGGLVQLAAGRHQQLAGLLLVARLDGLPESTDRRVKRRLHRLVAQSAALVGAIALFLRLDVGHAVIPSKLAVGVT